MRSVLIAFDGSPTAEALLRRVLRDARPGELGTVHLLNVQAQLGFNVSQHVGRRVVRDFQQEQGEAALLAGQRILDHAGVDYRTHVEIGDTARAILRIANRLQVDEIVMGATRTGFLGKALQYLLIARLIHRAAVPVVILAGEAHPRDLPLAAGRSRMAARKS
jgi:nucleotide-binding universal stress UspA family protein